MTNTEKQVGQLSILLKSAGFLPLPMTKECAYITIDDWKKWVATGQSQYFSGSCAGADDWGVLPGNIEAMYFISRIPDTAARLAEAQTRIADAVSKEYGHGEEWKDT